jgi:hypothetical protein
MSSDSGVFGTRGTLEYKSVQIVGYEDGIILLCRPLRVVKKVTEGLKKKGGWLVLK